VVAHATLSLSKLRSIASLTFRIGELLRTVPARFAASFAGNIRAESAYSFQAVVFHYPVRVVALKALRFATPALRAAIGLDRASREPRIAIIDGPPKGS